MGTYLFRWPFKADHVPDHIYVTGTFDDWGKTERLNKVDGAFEKEVHLPSATEKVFYKFVVDDEWIVDDRAPQEGDGHYNINNVLLPSEIQPITDATTSRKTRGHRVLSTSSAPPGTNSEGASTEAPIVSAGGEGAPLLTKEQSEANLARWIPHVIPRGDRPVTRRLPQTDGATSQAPSKAEETAETEKAVPGAFPDDEVVTAPSLPATGHQDIQSSVTTSKEDYDNAAGGEGTAGGVVSALPIPAEGHKDIESSATTSKEDYDKVGGVDTDDQQVSVNPLPATGHSDIQSSVTTSKEDYEKAGALGTAGLIAGAGAGAALAGAFSTPKLTDEKVIPESSLPMNAPGFDTKDTGPFINSAGPGTTTADLASQVPLEPKREAQVVDSIDEPVHAKDTSVSPFITSSGPGTTTADLASEVPLEPKHEAQVVSSVDEPVHANDTSISPFITSSGPGTTTADLASQVPLESSRDAPIPDTTGTEAPDALKEAGAAPFIASAATGATAAGLASQVPLEQKRQGQVFDEDDLTGAVPGALPSLGRVTGASPEIVAEKVALDKELLGKVPESEASGVSASAAKAQTSYYGLATAVPEPVEESMIKAHASPEAATESSAVAEKSAVERELQEKVPVVESAGEPAPTISAATATTAPEATSDPAASTAEAITDGKTANEAVPDTDTSTAARGVSAGEIAGGAVVGGAAAAGAAALAARHEDKEAEPPRVDTSVPVDEPVKSPAAGIGAASPHPGFSPVAAAALSDGTEDPTVADEPSAPKIKAPAETSEATATEYAPPRATGIAPGVSATAAAALSDGTEDPTLQEDDVKGKGVDPVDQAIAKPDDTVHDKTTKDVAQDASKTTEAAKSSSSAAVGASTTSPEKIGQSKSVTQTVSGSAPSTPKKGTTGASSSAAKSAVASSPASASTTPKSTTATEGDKKKKKRHRLSQIIHKIFD